MKKLLLETSFSKIYIVVMMLITLLIVGGYFSYAMFTVSKEQGNAISIITGNLVYDLEVDGSDGNTLTVGAGETKEFTVTLSNPNNRIARFNFYYEGSLPDGVTAGYITGEGLNTPPSEVGTNLETSGTAGSSNIYTIRVKNESSSNVIITLGVQVGLDYNDLTLPSNGYLFEEIKKETVADYVLDDQGPKGDIYDDGIDTFITGADPNNYIWYSGKLWRAVSVNNEAKTVKLVTQWNISTINYYSGYPTNFEESYMEEWLNDTTVDGFLGNLRDYENFIVTDAVGLLNMYEYQTSYRGTSYRNGYLNNGLYWWTLTLNSSTRGWGIRSDGGTIDSGMTSASGVRPSINLKSSVRIVEGDGTLDNPYRLEGDNDTDLSGTPLSSRYSGEYIRFGNEENNLYRIVSHENGIGTKITSTEPLKSSGEFIESAFGNDVTFSNINTIGTFLNGEYLTSYVDSTYNNMIEDSTTWYLGTVRRGSSYKLAKYTTDNTLTSMTTEAKVGLLRYGELMAGQFDRVDNNTYYWSLTPYSTSVVWGVWSNAEASSGNPSNTYGVRPSMNLKSNVVITDGDGTKNNPFTIELG